MAIDVFESVLDAIGNTPLFRLRRVGGELPVPIYAKAEFLSIGGSVKDRAARSMIDAAERDGSLRPGGTIVERTSGNTGIGLALVGRQRGYRVVVGVPDKVAKEKVDILQAYGAEVVLATTAVGKEHPDHLYNVVDRLAESIPGAWLANQYDNPANPAAHVATTGPEIWEQTGGRITHFVAGIGTGGTISGTAAYLKEVSNGAVTVIGADPEASTYAGGDGSPYFVESIGHFVHPDTVDDSWPTSYHPAVIDRLVRIGDRESLLAARRLAREDGLLAGPSSGTAVAATLRVAGELGPDDLVVVLLPDSGRSYLSKVHSDDWLREFGFLEDDEEHRAGPTVGDLVEAAGRRRGRFVVVPSDVTVAAALELVTAADADVTVVPIVQQRVSRPYGVAASEVLGALDVEAVRSGIAAGTVDPAAGVVGHRQPALPFVGVGQPLAVARERLGDAPSAVVLLDGRAVAIVTAAELDDRAD